MALGRIRRSPTKRLAAWQMIHRGRRLKALSVHMAVYRTANGYSAQACMGSGRVAHAVGTRRYHDTGTFRKRCSRTELACTPQSAVAKALHSLAQHVALRGRRTAR